MDLYIAIYNSSCFMHRGVSSEPWISTLENRARDLSRRADGRSTKTQVPQLSQPCSARERERDKRVPRVGSRSLYIYGISGHSTAFWRLVCLRSTFCVPEHNNMDLRNTSPDTQYKSRHPKYKCRHPKYKSNRPKYKSRHPKYKSRYLKYYI